jgi:5-methyltetrahydropteroyltriglutamate--homocysteine methyltransferase
MAATRDHGPPFRAEHVGSMLRPQELKNAFREFHAARMTVAAFREVQDRCIRQAVALQEEVGLQSITDGEFRRGSWFLGFVDAIEGLTTKAAPFDFHDAAGGTATFETADEFAFVRSITARTPKVTIPTPSLVHFLLGDRTISRAAYPDLDEFWADLITIYREELRELSRLGCTYVQLDEVPGAMLCDATIRAAVEAAGVDTRKLLDTYIGAVNQVARSRPAGMTIAMHLCRGNYKGRWMAEGGYEPIAEKLFNEAAVDAFFLEYDTERAGSFEPLRLMPAGKTVVLGLISSKTPALEPVDGLRRRIEEASRYVPVERLCISPQCGFASSVGGNPLTIDDERAKLRRVVEVAELVWG